MDKENAVAEKRGGDKKSMRAIGLCVRCPAILLPRNRCRARMNSSHLKMNRGKKRTESGGPLKNELKLSY